MVPPATQVAEMGQNYLVCAKHNGSRVGLKASKETVPVLEVPLSQWARDVVDTMPVSADGNHAGTYWFSPIYSQNGSNGSHYLIKRLTELLSV